MTILERSAEKSEITDAASYRLFKAQDNRLLLEVDQAAGQRLSSSSGTVLEASRRYHLALIGDGPRFSPFINGRREGSMQLR
ncbi:MAG: hypothetical protein M3Y07_13255, partial [Acidobacteriota bacterium]|nr:hypothetical protein [Acidobacteriota bacterium]